MATLDQWAYNFRNIARAGAGNSDDDTLGIRQIKFWIQGYRAVGIEQKTNYGKDINPQLVSDFGILELQEIDQSDTVNCQGIEWGCKIMKVVIPNLVDLPKNRALLFIGKIDKQTNFQKDDANTHEFVSETRFGHLITRYFIVGTTVYIGLSKKDEGIKYVNARGVVEDPTQLKWIEENEEGECVEVCFDDAVHQYPLTMNLFEFISTNIMQKELGMTLQTVESLLNNARNEIQTSEPQG